MIDYETFVKIKVFKDQHGLNCSQIARELNLDYRTVEKCKITGTFVHNVHSLGLSVS